MNCEFCTVKGKPRCRLRPSGVLEQFASVYENMAAGRSSSSWTTCSASSRDETLRLCRMLAGLPAADRRTVQHHRPDPAGQGPGRRTAARPCAGAGINVRGHRLRVAHRRGTQGDEQATQPAGDDDAGPGVPPRPASWSTACSSSATRWPSRSRSACPRRSASGVSAGSSARARIDTVQVLLPVPLPGTELTTPARAAAPDLRPSGRGAGSTTTGISRSLSPMTP